MADPKVVLITGTSSGIGADTARELAARGHHVVATMRNPDRDGPPVLSGFESTMDITRCDVTDQTSIDEAYIFTKKKYGRLDALINNAGYTTYGAVLEQTEEEIQQVFDANLYGPIRMMRGAVPLMRETGGGKILNVTSVAARLIGPLFGVYCATKTALEAVSEATRYELARHGIQVCLVAPGIVKTDNQFRSFDTSEAYNNNVSEYQETMQGMLEEVRKVANGRPGGRLNAVQMADLIEIDEQPLPLRVPVGEDTIRSFANRDAMSDDEWENMLWTSNQEGYPFGFFKNERAARAKHFG